MWIFRMIQVIRGSKDPCPSAAATEPAEARHLPSARVRETLSATTPLPAFPCSAREAASNPATPHSTLAIESRRALPAAAYRKPLRFPEKYLSTSGPLPADLSSPSSAAEYPESC